MSEENVEAVRRAFAAFNRRDMDAMLEEFDPEIEWHTATDLPDSSVFRGHDGVGAFIQEWIDAFEGLHGDVEEFIDRGECVVVPVVFRGRIPGSVGSAPEIALRRVNVYKLREGKASRIEMEQEFFMLFTFRGGKIVRIESILERDQALEAAGLPE